MRLINDAEHDYRILIDIVKDAKIVHPQPVLRFSEIPQSLDPALALNCWCVLEVVVNSVPHFRAVIRAQTVKVRSGPG